MLEEMVPFVGLLVGAVLSVVEPWVVSGLKKVGEAGSWGAFPKFEPKYLASLGIAVIVFLVAFLTVPGLFVAFKSWDFIAAVALAYSGKALGRDLIKGVNGIRTWRN